VFQMETFLKDPFFIPFVRRLAQGEFLFQQGQIGKTFFIILVGHLKLLSQTDAGEHLVAVVKPGEFLGEKSIVSEAGRLRIFTAEAMDDCIAVELGIKELALLQKDNPELVIEILKKSFEVAAQRLDKANYLARVLRGSDNEKRFLNCLLYLAQTNGCAEAQGILIPGLREALDYYLGLSELDREERLILLEAQGVLKKRDENTFLITSEQALLGILSELEQTPQAA